MKSLLIAQPFIGMLTSIVYILGRLAAVSKSPTTLRKLPTEFQVSWTGTPYRNKHIQGIWQTSRTRSSGPTASGRPRILSAQNLISSLTAHACSSGQQQAMN